MNDGVKTLVLKLQHAQVKFKVAVLIGVAAGLWACGPKVVPATAHGPLDPAQVKIYKSAPMSKYEKLGVLTWTPPASGAAGWREDADGTPAFEDLRSQAAKR